MSQLGDSVRRRRKELGLSQQAVADRMGAAGCEAWRTTISAIERGVTGLPDPKTLHALSASLDLPSAALLEAAGYGIGPDIDVGFVQLRQSYAEMDGRRRREIVILADALLRAQRLDKSG